MRGMEVDREREVGRGREVERERERDVGGDGGGE